MQLHISRHLESVALLSLPPEEDADGESVERLPAPSSGFRPESKDRTEVVDGSHTHPVTVLVPLCVAVLFPLRVAIDAVTKVDSLDRRRRRKLNELSQALLELHLRLGEYPHTDIFDPPDDSDGVNDIERLLGPPKPDEDAISRGLSRDQYQELRSTVSAFWAHIPVLLQQCGIPKDCIETVSIHMYISKNKTR
jgi:hypothetical protein